jgi:hypothetical protein
VYSNKQSAINKLSMSNIIYEDSDQDSVEEYGLHRPYLFVLQKRIKEALDNETSLKLCIIENNRKMSRASARTLPKFKEKARELENSLRITRVALEGRRKELKDFLRA